MIRSRGAAATTPKKAPGLRVSQIEVHVICLNEHDTVVPGPAAIFRNDDKGSATSHLAKWANKGLQAQLELHGSQLVTADQVDPLHSMTRADLKDLAKSYGLPTSGNRAELIARIEARHSETGGPVLTRP